MDVSTVGVIGCGLMGSGITEVAAIAGLDVVAIKATPGPVDHAIRRVATSLDRAVAKGKLTLVARNTAVGRVTFSRDMELLARCELVVETVVESAESKRRTLADIERVVPSSTIVTTNTSSLPLPSLATALRAPGRFLGLHFFSPVSAMKLVEVAQLASTMRDVVAASCRFLEKLGKTPILVGEEPGYIVNRLVVPYLCQAIEMLEQNVARAEDIDAAMKLGCGYPVGPLALADLIGLDVLIAMADTLSTQLGGERFKPPSLLKHLVLAGHLGKKTQRGLYDYRGDKPIESGEIAAACAGKRAPGIGQK